MADNAVDGAVVIGVEADTQEFEQEITRSVEDQLQSFKELFETLSEQDRQLEALAQTYNTLTSAIKSSNAAGEDSSHLYEEALTELINRISETEKHLEYLKEHQEEVNQAYANSRPDVYADYEKQIADTALQLKNLREEQERLSEEANRSAEQVSDDLSGISNQLDNVSKSAKGAGDKSEDFFTSLMKSKIVSAAISELLKILKDLEQEIVGIVTNAGEMGNVIDKQSQKLGMTEEAYQEWSYILSQNGADISSLTVGMRTLTNQIDGLKNGSKNATQAFNQLGLSLSDLQGLTGEEQFSLVIERLQGIEDETQRNAIANDVLGRSYMQLIPLLNQSADSVEALRQRAHDTNQLMSSEGIDAAVKYTDAMDTLTKSFEGFKNNIGAEILPGITEIIEGITDLVNGVDGAEDRISKGIDDVFEAFESILPKIGEMLDKLIVLGAEKAPEIITKIVEKFNEHLPELVASGGRVLTAIIQGIVDNLDDITSAALQIVLYVLNGITQGLADPQTYKYIFELFGELGYNLVMGIADGILNFDWETLSAKLVKRLADVFNEAQKNVKVWIDNIWTGGEVYGGDVANASNNPFYNYVFSDKYEKDLEHFWDNVRDNFESGKEQIDKWYESGKKAMGLDWLNHESKKVKEEAKETAEEVTEAAQQYTQAITTAAEDEEDKLNEVLQKKLDTLDHAYKTHKISEVAYWAKRKELLEQYRDEDNTAWWEVYDDVLDHYNTLAETIKKGIENTFSTLKSKTDEAEKKFKASSETIINSVKEEATNGIKGLKSSFTELLNAYQKGYNDILTQRNSYKQKLMGGSIFEVLQKTDEETGEQYTQYTIHNLSERLRTRTAYAQQMAKLEQRNLAKGLQQELEGLDAETGLVFAKQLNAMSDEEFNQLNAAYNKLDEETTKLANEKYQDELDSLQTNFIDACTALFQGMGTDLQELGADGALQFIQAFQKGFENDGQAVKESVTTFLDTLSNSVTEGTADLSTLIADSLDEQGYEIGSSLVDQMISAVNDKKTDFEQALTDLFDVTGLDTRIISDVESRSARYSEGGYRAATYIADSATDSSNAKANSGTQTITANLKLLDGTGRVLAEIVNAENKRLQIGAGA